MSDFSSSLPAPVGKYDIHGENKKALMSKKENLADNDGVVKDVLNDSDSYSGLGGVASFLSKHNNSDSARGSIFDRFESIVSSSNPQHTTVDSNFGALVERDNVTSITKVATQEEIENTAASTKAAIEEMMLAKGQALSSQRNAPTKKEEPQIVRYTPSSQTAGFTPATSNRIVKIVTAKVDPLDPSSFKQEAVRAAPKTTKPTAIVRSPPRKATAEDHANWQLPPSLSNWKNKRGFLVPLDKRIANDGRNGQMGQIGQGGPGINENFAKLSEALLIAERRARAEVETRANIEKKLQDKERQSKELELLAMARGVRDASLSSAGALDAGVNADAEAVDFEGIPQESGFSRTAVSREPAEEDAFDLDALLGSATGTASRSSPLREQKSRAEEERERMRQEHLKEMERAMRMKKQQPANRDISERMALGLTAPAPVATGEAMFDARLFNQTSAFSANFGAEDEYAVYDKQWMASKASGLGAGGGMHRAKRADDTDVEKELDTLRSGANKRFREENGDDFEGAPRQARSGPVEFERQQEKSSGNAQSAGDDPFGLEAIIGGSQSSERRNALSGIGNQGGMLAAAGGVDRSAPPSGQREIKFSSGSSQKF